MKITLKVFLYKRTNLIPLSIDVNETNSYEVRFLLEKEAERLKKLLKRFKAKGIIKSLSKNPKVKDIKYKMIVKRIIIARRSALQGLKLLRIHR